MVRITAASVPLVQSAGTAFAGRLEAVQEAVALQQSVAEARQVRRAGDGPDCSKSARGSAVGSAGASSPHGMLSVAARSIRGILSCCS